ncbi:MAG TPA: hypothetical protein VFU80_09125 [Sphingomicrobium sp.]|nr:hypothetical protein [Sphingomicrobium sp.]
MGWTARLLIGLVLILAGAAAAIWGLARSEYAARLLGVVPAAPPAKQPQVRVLPPQQSLSAQGGTLNPAIANQIAELQARVQRVEGKSKEAQGSAGRADALLIAFAARRAVERGVALGYLEPLLVDRFGSRHPQAVATIVTASRSPVRLTELIAQYQDLEPELLGPSPDEDLWSGIKRGFSSLVSVRRSDRPSTQPQARYERAMTHLMAGEVNPALAETMRLPGAPRAREWISNARQYVAVRMALDQIESAALIGEPDARAPIATAPQP